MTPVRPLAGLLAAALLTPAAAEAETRAVAPEGGGLAALEVRVDLAAGLVEAGALRVPIPLESSKRPGEADVVVEAVAIGLGKHVVHVRVPVRGDVTGVAWEAVLAAGKSAPIFAGMTGLTGDDPGERSGKAVEILPNGATRFVLVGDAREDLGICGQRTTLLDPLALYPATLDLRPATVQRLEPERLRHVEPIEAMRATAADPPLAQLLVARGSSVAGSRGAELTDGDPRTAWTERRPGSGQGEFVVFATSGLAPLTRLRLLPPPPGDNRIAPRTLYLATEGRLFEVTLPDDGAPAPQGYDVAFPEPLHASCLALVLDSASVRAGAHPDVGLAEVLAYGVFDRPGATLDDVARELSGARGDVAAQVLERAGAGALGAVEKAFDGLDPAGQARAMDVAAAADPCEKAAGLLSRGLCVSTGQAARRASDTLARCRAAAPVLARRVREERSARACLAPALATLAPDQALEAIADALGSSPPDDRETRATLRAAFSAALALSPPRTLAKMIADPRRGAAARLEMLRAGESHVTEAPAETEASVLGILASAADPSTRYLALPPLAALARAGQAKSIQELVRLVAEDPDWTVRAQAVESASGVAGAEPVVLAATRDAAPRVREAALEALGASSVPAVDAAAALLEQDHWSFVRVQAAGVLSRGGAGDAADGALGKALGDRSALVRAAVLDALARHRAWVWRAAIRERLDDQGEDSWVRAAAGHAAGGVCDVDATDRLTELARSLATATDEDGQRVALGALAGLAALKPADMARRLEPLLVKSAPLYARAAAKEALASPGTCAGANSR